MHPLRNHKSYIAAIGHRLSGLALAIFLPFHFLLLGTALEGAENLDAALAYTDSPLVKIAEWGLVMLLALHLLFGLRVLLLEFTRWPNHAETIGHWVLPGAIASAFVGVIFLLQVL
ncbi:MAG: succinate dehydrogenase, cytochrome b556 subunit [Gammaproteobacteria bacterium]|nr:succinate dehydrogenase, cytochrome b556 subunit [Gammaproteobacteria bacterium]